MMTRLIQAALGLTDREQSLYRAATRRALRAATALAGFTVAGLARALVRPARR